MHVTTSSWKSPTFLKGFCGTLSNRAPCCYGATASLDSLGTFEGLAPMTKLPLIVILSWSESSKVVFCKFFCYAVWASVCSCLLRLLSVNRSLDVRSLNLSCNRRLFEDYLRIVWYWNYWWRKQAKGIILLTKLFMLEAYEQPVSPLAILAWLSIMFLLINCSDDAAFCTVACSHSFSLLCQWSMLSPTTLVCLRLMEIMMYILLMRKIPAMNVK